MAEPVKATSPSVGAKATSGAGKTAKVVAGLFGGDVPSFAHEREAVAALQKRILSHVAGVAQELADARKATGHEADGHFAFNADKAVRALKVAQGALTSFEAALGHVEGHLTACAKHDGEKRAAK